MAPPDTQTLFRTLIARKERHWIKLQNCYDLLPQLDDEEKRSQFLTRAEVLDKTYQSFEETIDELSVLVQTKPELGKVDHKQQMSTFDDMFFAIMSKFRTLKATEASSDPRLNSVVNSGSCSKLKLPRINIQPFDGQFELFSAFKTLYDGAIHDDPNLSPIEKFTYLLSHLKGPALTLVQTVTFASENYFAAYDLLVSRYNNKRIVGGYYLDKLLSLEPLRSATGLRALTDKLEADIASFSALNLPDPSNFILLHLTSRLLDHQTRSAFEDKFLDVEFPSIKQLLHFLRGRCTVSTLVGDISNKNNFLSKDKRKVFAATSDFSPPDSEIPSSCLNSNQSVCPCHKGCLKFAKCPVFRNSSPEKRLELTKLARRCFACLGFSHMLNKCSSTYSCSICASRKHHTMLHDAFAKPNKSENATNAPVSNTSLASENFDPVVASVSASPTSKLVALLGTARVRIQSVDGSWYSARAVLDWGSQTNLITNKLVEKLGLRRKQCPFGIAGVGTSSQTRVQGLVNCVLSSHVNISTPFNLPFEAAVLPKITNNLPSVPLSAELLQKFSNLPLADPEFHQSASIDILLGIQAVMDITPDEPSHIKGQPSAISTSLGWVILGSVPFSPSTTLTNEVLSSFSVTTSLDKTLKAFWETEEISTPRIVSPDDEYCENHFVNTHTRHESGQYQVQLPFKDGIRPVMGNNRNRALSRFSRLELRFKRDPVYFQLYKENLLDYTDRGHMALAPSSSNYLLSHHGVVKTASSESKLRVVFNPTEKDSNGISLNSCLLPGPKLQKDLGEVLTRFRTYPVALKCDVCRMFRAIDLHPEDRKYLHLLWRFSPNEPLSEWELTTVTFGLTSSPFLAIRVLNQLAIDEQSNFPSASEIVKYSSYVDDILGGAENEQDALELQRQLIALMKSGGFDLGKWASSSPQLLDDISPELQELPDPNSDVIKILGMVWDPKSDQFLYTFDASPTVHTKRGILSKIARTYDINGYISPVTFLMKVMMQDLWLCKVDWDDPLPPDVSNRWIAFENDFSSIQSLRIPRKLLPSKFVPVQLIGFADASSKGMCAAIYLRVEVDSRFECSLVKSKTKVAPLKTLSIPRLELVAAHLLAKSIAVTVSTLSFLNIEKIICMSDSSTVLSWIKTSPHLLKVFEANRVVQIHELCPLAIWRHIPGDLNPADLGSRGCFSSQLLDNNVWWNGPEFLSHSMEDWPPSHYECLPTFSDSPQEVFITSREDVSQTYIDLTARCSTFSKLQRVTAYLFRFAFNFIKKSRNCPRTDWKFGPIMPVEYRNSTEFIIKMTQAHYLDNEIKVLKKNQVPAKLRALTPFLSSSGLIMVGGRLSNASLPANAKHPFLIPNQSRLAALICDHYHIYSSHGGPQLVQSLIHRYYWIQSARNLIRKRIFKCITCYRFLHKPTETLMGDLPHSRVNFQRCFAQVGVDMAGPFFFKMTTRRNARVEKCYLAIYVCMAIKAVHIEVVTALTTEAFLASLDRFIARRGLPSHIFSDQGRNFRGAARQIDEIYRFLDQETSTISQNLSLREIVWVFNPPYSPHFGGLWEAAVKSAKHHFKKVVGEHHLTLEEMNTVLARIEAALNSRPLCVPSTSPNDSFDYLTPGHFLIGCPLLARPEVELSMENPNLLKRWQFAQQLVHRFWKRWSQDYLHCLQQRPKWTTPAPNLQEGRMVLLRDPNYSPLTWPLGRVERLFPGKDGIVRVVEVRTPKGLVTRPINRLAILPIEED